MPIAFSPQRISSLSQYRWKVGFLKGGTLTCPYKGYYFLSYFYRNLSLTLKLHRLTVDYIHSLLRASLVLKLLPFLLI